MKKIYKIDPKNVIYIPTPVLDLAVWFLISESFKFNNWVAFAGYAIVVVYNAIWLWYAAHIQTVDILKPLGEPK